MKIIKKWVPKVILAVLGASFLFPLYWMINLSFKGKSEVYDNPFGLPREWVFTNYGDVLEKYPFFKYMGNSAIYTFGTAMITIVFGAMLAYAIARMRWKFSRKALTYVTMGLVIPVQVSIIPLYTMLGAMGLRGSRWALILPYSAFALGSVSYTHLTLPTKLEV